MEHDFHQFSAEYHLKGMKISTKMTEVLCISRNLGQCTLQKLIVCMVVGRIISRVEPVVDFSGGGHTHFFQGGPIMVKFHFVNSKLREKYFSTKTLL